MSNERLRASIRGHGQTVAAVAQHVGVDPKTVERWITTGRLPHRTHRDTLSQLLTEDEVFLWPEVASSARTLSASEAELVTLHPNRGSVPITTWMSLLDGARESIDLHAFAGSFLHDAVPDFDERVVDAARRGVFVRLLFADPDGGAARRRGEEEGIGDLLAARCRLTWNYLASILDTPGIEARQHDATVYASLFRFDETLLANTHTYGTAASHSPMLHLRRVVGGRLFATYVRSFERVWALSAPAAGSQPPHGAA